MSVSPSADVIASLEKLNLNPNNIHYQLSPEELQDITVDNGRGKEASSGALAVNTGEFTGRSPKDRFIVKDDITKDKIWWGD
ncbi:phosphoenolpyruvate carboxykinase (ATP), partial [Flagellimonas abyssi]